MAWPDSWYAVMSLFLSSISALLLSGPGGKEEKDEDLTEFFRRQNVRKPAAAALSPTHENFVFGELQLLHSDHVFAINCCLQGGLVDQIFQIGAGEPDCSSGDNVGLDGCGEKTEWTCRLWKKSGSSWRRFHYLGYLTTQIFLNALNWFKTSDYT